MTTVSAERENEVPAPDAYPALLVGWRATVILFLLYVLSMLDRNILTLLINPIKADLGLGDFEMSLLIGIAFAFFYAVMALPLGYAIDRFSRRIVIFWCVIVWSFATMLCGVATSFALLFMARALVGGGEAALAPGAQSILADLFPPTKLALPLSVFSLGGKAGQAISLLIGGLLTTIIAPTSLHSLPLLGADIKGWQLIFLIIGAPGLLIAFLIFTFPEPVRRTRISSGASANYGEYWRFLKQHWRLIVPSHLGSVMFLAAVVSAINWAPAHIERAFGWSAAQVGAGLGIALFVGPVLGMPFHGAVADRLFRKGILDIHLRYMMFTALVGLPIGIAAFVVRDPILCILLAGLFFFVTTTYVGLSITALQVVVPGNLRGKAAAVFLLAGGLGGASLGPMLVGALTDFAFGDPNKVGWSIAITLAILLPLTAFLFFLALAPMRNMVSERDRAADGHRQERA